MSELLPGAGTPFRESPVRWSESERVSRRRFVRRRGVGAIGGPLLGAACAPAPNQTSGGGTTAGAGTGTGGSSARLQLPTYVPVGGPAPDLPSTPEGVDAAYFTYPKSLVKSVLDTPGKGETVSAIVSSVLAAPVAME